MAEIPKMMIEIETCRCQCGRPFSIPIKPDWNSPLFVMEMERRVERAKEQIVQLENDLLDLAVECVEAGVRPSYLRRSDEVLAKLRELRDQFPTAD